jgi:hypothetical protein
VATILWYFIVIWMGATTASASDIYEPIAVAWSFGAIAGVFALRCGGRNGAPVRRGQQVRRVWQVAG